MKTIIITGASDGIGRASAKALHDKGHRVVLVGRSPEKTRVVSQELGDAPYYLADFADLASVRKLARALRKAYPRIDVLALNAGGIFSERTRTKDGLEMTFQVNHLAHFLLVGMLMNTLIASRASIIATSSSANYLNRLDLDDLNAEHGYGKWTAYGNAKLMNILFTRELTRRYGKKGITSAAFHPGVVRTSFSRDLGPVMKFLYSTRLSHALGIISPEQGADTLVWLAQADRADWKSGEYYVKRRIARSSRASQSKADANGLWNESEDLLLDKLEY